MAYPGFYTNNKIFVKISLDGARFTRQSTYCILSFAVLFEKETISSEGKRCNLIGTELLIVILIITDLHTVAIIKAEENYENLKDGFANCFNELSSNRKSRDPNQWS